MNYIQIEMEIHFVHRAIALVKHVLSNKFNKFILKNEQIFKIGVEKIIVCHAILHRIEN